MGDTLQGVYSSVHGEEPLNNFMHLLAFLLRLLLEFKHKLQKVKALDAARFKLFEENVDLRLKIAAANADYAVLAAEFSAHIDGEKPEDLISAVNSKLEKFGLEATVTPKKTPKKDTN